MKREDCRLRPLEEEDLAIVLEWRNSERIRANMYTDHLISWEEHLGWFARVRNERPSRFMVFTHEGRLLGVVNFTELEAVHGTAHWGFYIGREDSPRGSGFAMACLALEYAFCVLGIRKLIGEAFSFNEASVAYHRKLGFVEEGHFARHVLKNDRHEDVVSFALFQDDWLKGRQSLEQRCFGTEGNRT